MWVQEEARPSVSFKEHFFVVEKIKRTKNQRERQRNFTGTTTGIGGAEHGGY